MSDVSAHFIHDDCIQIKDGKVIIDAGLFDGEENGPFPIAWTTPANQADVDAILAKEPTPNNTRSGWCWLRLRDGTLMLGFFPQGDTYMEYSDGDVCNFGEAP